MFVIQQLRENANLEIVLFFKGMFSYLYDQFHEREKCNKK